MNYEDLRRFQRMERNSTKLAQIDKDFYLKLSELTRYYKTKAHEDSEHSKSFENILKVSRDIFERREQKILMKALRFVRSGETEQNALTAEEKKFFDSTVDALKNSRNDFEKALIGEKALLPKIDDIPALLEPETSDIILVRTVKKLPRFVSFDLKEYGPFDANEVIRLPKKETELLINRKLVEII
jgi:DNA replication initiation complex subunit (GINS family)